MIDVILGQDVPLYKKHEVALNMRSFGKELGHFGYKL